MSLPLLFFLAVPPPVTPRTHFSPSSDVVLSRCPPYHHLPLQRPTYLMLGSFRALLGGTNVPPRSALKLPSIIDLQLPNH